MNIHPTQTYIGFPISVAIFYTPVLPAASLHHELGVTGSCDGGTVQQVVNHSLINYDYTISVELKLEGKTTTEFAGFFLSDISFYKCY